MTYAKRLKMVEEYASAVKRQYPQTDQYNILVFGSFLTERYSDDSDIDIVSWGSTVQRNHLQQTE